MENPGAFDLLQPLGFFTGLSPAILHEVSLNCTQVLVPAGRLLFRQGDPSDSLYIVATGRLDVSIEIEGHDPASIYEAGRGQIVGEMGLLTGDPRSATVRSLRDSLLFRLSKQHFEELLQLYPALTRRIACDLSERLKQSNVRSFHRNYSVKTFAVMPAGEVGPTVEFVERLSHALGEIGPTLRIDRATVEQEAGSSDMSDGAVIGWLNEQEAKFAFLIYQTDLEPSPWTFGCIRQADRILSVARFENGRNLNLIEHKLARMAAEPHGEEDRGHPRINLILLHRDAGFRPSGTPQWLNARSVEKHHHICADSEHDFRRLARILTGKGIGLVLGGGGARAFAHIGAIRAIEEAGITIETIGGTSQGALIGAQYAMGLSADQMIDTNRVLFRDFRPFRGDMTVPIFSFLSGVTTNKGLQGLFGKTYISDLRIPFFSIATNLSLATLIVDRDHLVWKAVRCSMSLPGLMPPVIEGGHLIGDGGVLNNLPVDIMRQHCNGGIIAVDVSPPVDLLADCEDRYTLSFLDYVRRRFRRQTRGSIPHLIEILMRTVFLSSIHHRETMSKHADLLVHPPMSGFGLLDWDNLDTLVEIGYETTREKLKHWTGSTSDESRPRALSAEAFASRLD